MELGKVEDSEESAPYEFMTELDIYTTHLLGLHSLGKYLIEILFVVLLFFFLLKKLIVCLFKRPILSNHFVITHQYDYYICNISYIYSNINNYY